MFRRWVHHSSHTSMAAKEIINELIFGPNCTVFQGISTATVERNFNTLNRIACAQRNRLDDCHQNCLLRMSSEGPDSESSETTTLIEKAVQHWLTKKRKL